MARTARNIPAHVRETLGRVAQLVDDTIGGLQKSWELVLVLPQENRRPYPIIKKTKKHGRVLVSRTGARWRKMEPTNTEVFKWFSEKRDIAKMTPTNRRDIARELRQQFSEDWRATHRMPTGLEVKMASFVQYKQLLVDRFAHSGGDLKLKPLSSAWKHRKQLLHLDPRIGVASGQLAAAIARAQVVVRNTR